MKTFLDTSVLVAAALETHEHHTPSLKVFSNADRDLACCGAHTLAELYSTLTRLPRNKGLNESQALLYLDEVESRLELIYLTSREYRLAINGAATRGVIGGAIYDALLAQCALKAEANRILTWNVVDFARLGPEIASKVATP